MPVLAPYDIVLLESSPGVLDISFSEDNPAITPKVYHVEYKYGVLSPWWFALPTFPGAVAPTTSASFNIGSEVCVRVRVEQGGDFSQYSPTECIQLSDSSNVSLVAAKFQISGDCSSITFWDLTGQQPYHHSGYPAGLNPSGLYTAKIIILDSLGVTELGSHDVEPSRYPAKATSIPVATIVDGGLSEGVYIIRYEVYDGNGDVKGFSDSALLIACNTSCALASIGHAVAASNGSGDRSSDFWRLSSLLFNTIPALIHQGDYEDAEEVLDYVKSQVTPCC